MSHRTEEDGNPEVGIEDPVEETADGAEDPSTEDLDEDPSAGEDGEAVLTILGGEEGTTGEEATLEEMTGGEAVGGEMIGVATPAVATLVVATIVVITIAVATTEEVTTTEVGTIMIALMQEVQANMAKLRMTITMQE
jgi:hypothetical protein